MNDLLGRNRKFKLALLILIGGIVLAFIGKLSGEYIALAGIILGAYNFANVAHKRVTGNKGIINDINVTEK